MELKEFLRWCEEEKNKGNQLIMGKDMIVYSIPKKMTLLERIIAIALFTIVFLAMLSGLVSCTERNVNIQKTEYVIWDEHKLYIVVVDSCEYLYGPWGNATVLTHKGNCKNNIHQK